MRTTLLFCATLIASAAAAQCDFDPEISPGEVILCPNESVTLEVGEYDDYQWFQDGQPISTASTITVSEVGSSYTVEVTLDGCTEMSPAVLVDGWVFLLPFVIHSGDTAIATGPNGESYYCEGQTLILEMGMPYTENITWTNNGVPIPGEEGQTLVVTESGNYSASAAPNVCPNYILNLGVTITVEFLEPQQPEIMVNDDELCAFPLGTSYTWYLNGEELEGETTACITADSPGAYTVYVDYGQNCQVMSEPHLTTSIQATEHNSAWMIYPNPSNGSMNIAMDAELSAGAFYSVFDAAGREVANGWMPLNGLLQLDLQNLEPGTYLFQAARDGKALASASRFTIVK